MTYGGGVVQPRSCHSNPHPYVNRPNLKQSLRFLASIDVDLHASSKMRVSVGAAPVILDPHLPSHEPCPSQCQDRCALRLKGNIMSLQNVLPYRYIGAMAAAVLTLVVGASARADVLHVPSQYPTIQTGIDAAVNGDVVEIADGTYTGVDNKNLDFSGKAITVRSASGDPALCVIDCEQDGRGFHFHSGEGPDSVVEGMTVTNGYVDKGSPGGGGVRCYGSSPTLTNCTITGNSARNGGGVRCSRQSSPTLTNCTISGNTAEGGWGENGGGGGIRCYNGSNPTLIGCTISGNSADGGGGGVRCHGSSPTLTNCTITGNSAHNGGGVRCSGQSSPTLTNCTISGNRARWSGGVLSKDSSPTLTNCILWNDTPQEFHLTSGTLVVTYCNVQGGWPGTGNIKFDPLFVDPGNADYRLSACSPCIDAGDNDAVPFSITTDLDGNPRFVDDPGRYDIGNGIPPLVDMGCYEFQDDSLGIAVLTVSPDPLFAGQDGIFTVVNTTPHTATYLAYSLHGLGSFYVPFLNVTLDLEQPMRAGIAKPSDAGGNLKERFSIPSGMAGRDAWFQAVQMNLKTNVVVTTIVE